MPRRNPKDQQIFIGRTIHFANIMLTGTGHYAEKSRTGASYFNIKDADGVIVEAILTGTELSRAAAKIAKAHHKATSEASTLTTTSE